MKSSVASLTVLVLGFLAFRQEIHGAAYTFTPIDVPGALSTSATGINNAGDVVGSFEDHPAGSMGFLYTNGVITTINVPGAVGTSASAISNSGTIAGSFTDVGPPTIQTLLFTDTNGVFSQIAYPDATSIGANGINNSGEIVGRVGTGSHGTFGIVYINGVFSTFHFPGMEDQSIAVEGINDSGAIVGFSFEGGFVDNNGVFTTFNPPDSSLTEAFAISDSGLIVGNYFDSATSQRHGFLYENGVFMNVDDPLAAPGTTELRGINDAGQIIGFYSDSSGGHGFLATPIPEPTSLLLFASGLAGIIILIVRRRITRTSTY
jgi:probable HAF family extracellular repeat protein